MALPLTPASYGAAAAAAIRQRWRHSPEPYSFCDGATGSRVYHPSKEVDEKGHEHECKSCGENHRLEDRVVPSLHRIKCKRSEPRPAENILNHDDPSDEATNYHTEEVER